MPMIPEGRLFRKQIVPYLLAIPTILFAEPVFEIVRDGEPRCVIVIPDSPTPADQDGVDELNYWVQRISGTSLPVRKEAEWDGTPPSIFIGSRDNGSPASWNTATLGLEEAKIVVEPERVALLGRGRVEKNEIGWPLSFERISPQKLRRNLNSSLSGPGSYYATLEFIREGLGVRWIWPGPLGEVYTPRRTITISPAAWSWSPPASFVRTFRFDSAGESADFRKTLGILTAAGVTAPIDEATHTWRQRQRMSKPGHLSSGHAFTDWWARYAKTNPDFFAKPPEGVRQFGGPHVKLNLSNPDVAATIIRNWQSAANADPTSGLYLSVAPNDLSGYDTRPETRAWDAPEMASLSEQEIWISDEGTLSDRYVHFWNIIAGEVRKINPQTRVVSLAYSRYRKPPLKEDKIADNILIGYVGGEGFYPDEHTIAPEYRAWSSLGAQLFWRPNLFHAGHGIPYLYSRKLFSDIHALHKAGLHGYDFDSLVEHWSGQGLNYHVASTSLNHPTRSYEEIVTEYYDAFGAASEPVRKYHEFFENLTEEKAPLLRNKELVANESWGKFWRGHIRLVPIIITDAVLAQAESFLLSAERASRTGGDETSIARVALLRKNFDHMRLMAETFRAISLDQPTKGLSLRHETLKPLWELRMSLLKEFYFSKSTLRLLYHEQVQFGIWSEFIDNAKLEGANLVAREIATGWEIRPIQLAEVIEKGWYDSQDARWQAIPSLAAADTTSEAALYRCRFDMPQLSDNSQVARLRIEGVKGKFALWINGKKVPTESIHPLKGENNKGVVVINIIEYIKQGMPCQVAFRTLDHESRAKLAEKVFLLSAE